MQDDLNSSEQAVVITSVNEIENGAAIEAFSTDLPLIEKLALSLQSCDLGEIPGANGSPAGSATSTGVSTPQSSHDGGLTACDVPEAQNHYSVTVSSPGCGFAGDLVAKVMASIRSSSTGTIPTNLTVTATHADQSFELSCSSPQGPDGLTIVCSHNGQPWITLYLDSAEAP
jgi:hypothetical protein